MTAKHASNMTSPFSRNFTYSYGKIIDISDNLRVVVASNQTPFTFTGTNTFIIGRGDVAILDPGPLDDAHLGALLNSLKGETISHILISHTHNDHVALTRELQKRTGAKTYAFGASTPSQEKVQPPEQMDDARDRNFSPDIPLSHKDILTIGEVTLETLHTPGHTEDHVCFSLKQDDALLCGDHVMGWSTSIIAPPDGHMGDYLSSLNKLLERKEKIYHPTHGDPVINPIDFVEFLIDHRHKREAAILDKLTSGPTDISEIVKDVYVGLDKSLTGAAMLSTRAHLIWLEEKNMVENEMPEGNPLTKAIYRLL